MTAEDVSRSFADYAHLFDLRRLVRNLGWLGLDKIVRMFVGLAIKIVLVRLRKDVVALRENFSIAAA